MTREQAIALATDAVARGPYWSPDGMASIRDVVTIAEALGLVKFDPPVSKTVAFADIIERTISDQLHHRSGPSITAHAVVDALMAAGYRIIKHPVVHERPPGWDDRR